MTGTKHRFSILDIAQAGIMVAVIEVSKMALSGMPNIELTSFWLIMFTLFFGWKIVVVVPAFILVEGAFYGMHLWWIMYLYAWPLLVLIAWLFRKNTSAIFWAIVSGTFGLMFGALCSIPYFVIGLSSGGVAAGLRSAFGWWTVGIPWDFIHCAGNFVIMLVLYRPISEAMKWISRERG
ncbi:MAG: hypothetical protein K6E70_10215 [Butyrivibrio sp.]|nr:hypothetical protein [Butyrivibrio sp.]